MDQSISGQSGLFITIEGVEGAGKSTSTAFIKHWLSTRQISHVLTREPGGTALGEKLRAILLEDHVESLTTDAELLLIFAARAQHLKQIIYPALKQNKVVVCDRFTDATYAYQGAGRKMGYDRIARLESLVQMDFRPGLTFILDVPVEIGMERVQKRGLARDRFEKEQNAFFESVRQSYIDRARVKPERYKIIDASRSAEQVNDAIAAVLANYLETGD